MNQRHKSRGVSGLFTAASPPVCSARRGGVAGALLASGLTLASATAHGLELELADLNGTNGFVVNGVAGGDETGYSVSAAGDVNGDGTGDLLIGARSPDPNGSQSGASYVVFGGAGVGSGGVVELSALDGTNGFVLNGVAAGDQAGRAVSAAGDVNDDGADDLLIGAALVDTNGGQSGAVYVVLGGAGVGGSGVVELSALDGTNGFVLNGVAANDYSGWSLDAAGDVNGDGVEDLLVGARGAAPNGASSGATYVVFGGAAVGSGGVVELSTLDGTNGFVLSGVAAGDQSGGSVSAAGDVNGDGSDDLLIGARFADPNGNGSGATYVVFGGAGAGSLGVVELSALDGTDGFVLNGVAAGDCSGNAVSAAGDVNGDGVDDLLAGAACASPNGIFSGASYVVLGGAGVGGSGVVELSALDGTDGFALNGVAAEDFSGNAVSAAGDVNGDGVDDLLIGAPWADPNGSRSGVSYVVFGAPGVGSGGVLELTSLDGTNGIVLNGVTSNEYAGTTVGQAGDVNGDGVGDLIIGAYGPGPEGDSPGVSYVVFGGTPGPGGTMTGASGMIAACVNTATGRIAISPLEGKVAWDCDWNGLQVDPGQDIETIFVGNATGEEPFGGVPLGFNPGPMLVRCRNATTGQILAITQSGISSWDCDAAGLVVSAGDIVDVLLRGRKGE